MLWRIQPILLQCAFTPSKTQPEKPAIFLSTPAGPPWQPLNFMAKIDITKTELVWPGKYNEDGTLHEVPHVHLPFQIIERVNESRATREAKKLGIQTTLFEAYQGTEGETFEDGWRNKLIWGDNLLVMGSLLEKFAGEVDLIYIDPPFDTGSDFSYRTIVGSNDDPIAGKDPSMIEEKAYRDTWGSGYNSYLTMMRDRLLLLKALLAPTGSIFVHLDVHTGPYMKVLMDEIFGQPNFQNEIAWYYYNKLHDSRKNVLPKAFDQILYYVKDKTSDYHYTSLKEPREKPVVKLKYKKVGGKIQNIIGDDGKAVTYVSTERTVDNVWRIRCLQCPASSRARCGQANPDCSGRGIVNAAGTFPRVLSDGGQIGGFLRQARYLPRQADVQQHYPPMS